MMLVKYTMRKVWCDKRIARCWASAPKDRRLSCVPC